MQIHNLFAWLGIFSRFFWNICKISVISLFEWIEFHKGVHKTKKICEIKKFKKNLPATGLEPAIPGLGGRCLIHWATRAIEIGREDYKVLNTAWRTSPLIVCQPWPTLHKRFKEFNARFQEVLGYAKFVTRLNRNSSSEIQDIHVFLFWISLTENLF